MDVVKLTVKDLTPYSDHCPVELGIYVTLKNKNKRDRNIARTPSNYAAQTETAKQYTWDKDSADNYARAFLSAEVQALLDGVTNNTGHSNHTADKVQDMVQCLSKALTGAAELSLRQKPRPGSLRKHRRKKTTKK